MSEEWLDVAYVNFVEAILWGTIVTGSGDDRRTVDVRVTLNEEQKRAVEDLNFKHQQETTKLLRSFVA